MTHIPDEKGWIEWNGGECPVEPGTLVLVQLREDDTREDIERQESASSASTWGWDHYGNPHDIIAYRVVQQP